jgi:hypothetical protein
MGSYVVMDEAAVDHFRGWNGPLGHSVNRLALETEWRARQYANVRSGALKASIRTERGVWHKGIRFHTGSDVPYALYVEEGTRPHEIRAKNAPFLVFFWPKVGRVVHFKRVQHPGTRPYKFLQRAQESAMRMWQRGG